MRKKKKRSFSIEKSVDGSDVMLLLSGPVDAEASTLLGPECARFLESDHQITLDLTDVPSADSVGLQLLLSLCQVGVTLTNVPTHIAKKIDVGGPKLGWLSRN